MLGGDGGDEDAQFAAVGCARHHLLPPVAEDVGGEGGVGLCAVVEDDALEAFHLADGFVGPVVFGHRAAVEEFAEEVAVPPDAEVDGEVPATECQVLLVLRVVGVFGAADDLAPDVAYAMAVAAPHLHAGVGGVDVGGHAPADVAIRGDLEDDLARRGVAQVGTVAAVLMAVPHLQAGALRVESHEVDGVAVPHAGVVEPAAIVIDGHGAVCDFVASVAVHVGHAEVVVALPGIVGPLWLVGVEGPAVCQFLAVPVPCGDDGARVVSPAEDAAEASPVEVSGGGEHAVGAVGVAVAPVHGVAALRDVGLAVHGLTGHAVEDGDVFRTGEDAAGHGPLPPVVFAPLLLWLRCLGLSGGSVAVVGSGVADHLALCVAGAVGGAHHHFGAAVTVEVADDERYVMRPAADVDAHVDAPEQRTVEAVAVEERGAGEAVVGVVAGVGGVPFQYEFILSVAVHVAHAGVVGGVGEGAAVGGRAAVGLLQGDGDVAVGGSGGEGVTAVAPAAAHLVGGGTWQWVLVDEHRPSRGQGTGVEFLPVSIDIEGLTLGVAAERAPTHHHPFTAAHGHHASVETLAAHLFQVVAGLCDGRHGKPAQHNGKK